MNRFRELLREARKRAGLTQWILGEKVGVADSYISRMETGAFPPPSREVTLRLADALGLKKKSRRRLVFLLAAGVASEEDMEGLKLVGVEDGQALGEEEQANSTPIPGIVHDAKPIPEALFGTPGEYIDSLIASTRLTDEEDKMVASVAVDTVKRLLLFIETQRKMRKEG
jgi:transcriptional regulator with XRE-family HTH domain